MQGVRVPTGRVFAAPALARCMQAADAGSAIAASGKMVRPARCAPAGPGDTVVVRACWF
jgi:hypothetical protein